MTRFSICLPVRNGMPYVKDCVQRILEQSCGDFELHILDNQSSDGTAEWLRSLTDQRISVSFSDQPLTIIESWARIKTLRKNEFITLIGHDDIFDKDFLQTISDLIDQHPDAALYQTGGRFIDSEGHTIRSCRPVPEREGAAGYLRARLKGERDVFGTGYVMRSSDYEQAGGIPAFEKLFFADDALWLTLMRGRSKVCEPSEHFAVRIHSGSESASLPSAWHSILKGLGQFSDFLQNYVREDAEVGNVFAQHAGQFFLDYHRNASIFALVEASLAGRRITRDAVEQLEKSLASCAPSVSDGLWNSTKVRVLRILNATPARALIPILWKLYYRLKNRAR